MKEVKLVVFKRLGLEGAVCFGLLLHPFDLVPQFLVGLTLVGVRNDIKLFIGIRQFFLG